MTTSDVALLAARAPSLTVLHASLTLPSGELPPSDDEGDEDEEAPAPVDLAASLAPPVDEYDACDEASFRFPFSLRELRLRIDVEDPDDGEAPANPNLTRLIMHIARLPYLHTLHLSFRPADFAALRSLSLLRGAAALRTLTLQSSDLSEFLELLPHGPCASLSEITQLEHLSLNRGEHEHASLAWLLRTAQWPQLQSFDLADTELEPRIVSLLCDAAYHRPALTHLTPKRWNSPRDLPLLLPLLPRLRVLHVKFRPVRPSPQEVPADAWLSLAHLTQLEELHVAHADLRSAPNMAEAGSAVLRAMPHLRVLHLTQVLMPLDVMNALADFVPELEHLHLQRTPIPVSCVYALAGMRRLHTLHLESSLGIACDLAPLLRYPSSLLPSLRCLHWTPFIEEMQYDHSDKRAATEERW